MPLLHNNMPLSYNKAGLFCGGKIFKKYLKKKSVENFKMKWNEQAGK